MTTFIDFDEASVRQGSWGGLPGVEPSVDFFPRQARRSGVLSQSVDEQLHEVRASLAGVATAVRLLVRHDSGLAEDRQHRLETMVESELDRLERLLFEPQPSAAFVDVGLAEVLEPVVLARRVAGQVIDWEPSEAKVRCVKDAVAEAMNILLVNAAKHASGSPVRLDVATVPGAVEVCVSDSGPGIPRPLRSRIFQPGFRGDGSGDHGLGLGLARRLVEAMGGALFLEEGAGPGASFVLRLPDPVR